MEHLAFGTRFVPSTMLWPHAARHMLGVHKTLMRRRKWEACAGYGAPEAPPRCCHFVGDFGFVSTTWNGCNAGRGFVVHLGSVCLRSGFDRSVEATLASQHGIEESTLRIRWAWFCATVRPIRRPVALAVERLSFLADEAHACFRAFSCRPISSRGPVSSLRKRCSRPGTMPETSPLTPLTCRGCEGRGG